MRSKQRDQRNGPYRRRRRRNLRPWYVAGVAILLVALAAAGWVWQHSPSGGPVSSAATEAAGAGPTITDPGPASPPVRVCGNPAILGHGPASAPAGAVVVPAGDDAGTPVATTQPNTTYWFAPGTHTLAPGQFSQFVPSDGDTFIGAPGAIIDGRHQNLYAFTQHAKGVTIRYLTIQNFGTPGDNGGQGVVNHDEGTGWHIDHVTVQGSAGAGVMLGTGNTLAYSCLRDNGEYGFQGGGAGITVTHDEVAGNNTDDWEKRQPGCGCTGGAKFWGVNGATVTANYVHDNLGPGLWADTNNRAFDVTDNYFANNQGEGFIYEISYNLRLAHNTFIRNALTAGPNVGGFPDPAVYISESGADRRVAGPYGQTLAITDNTFTDNWSGVVLWESADRYCGSPANTSTGECTLVDPTMVTTSSCKNPNLKKQPYYGDCRWKTQNVLVKNNVFNFNPAHIGTKCTTARFCGFNGIFSQWGSWQPYHGTMVENRIVFDQNNHFTANVYNGPWQFLIQNQSDVVSWAIWQARPYNQDVGSVLNGGKS